MDSLRFGTEKSVTPDKLARGDYLWITNPSLGLGKQGEYLQVKKKYVGLFRRGNHLPKFVNLLLFTTENAPC